MRVLFAAAQTCGEPIPDDIVLVGMVTCVFLIGFFLMLAAVDAWLEHRGRKQFLRRVAFENSFESEQDEVPEEEDVPRPPADFASEPDTVARARARLARRRRGRRLGT